jgi:hypothetical protein
LGGNNEEIQGGSLSGSLSIHYLVTGSGDRGTSGSASWQLASM